MDSFIGRLGIGRIRSGTIRKNTPIALSQGPGTPVRTVKVSELFNFDAMGRAPIDEAKAGEIVVFSGVQDFTIGVNAKTGDLKVNACKTKALTNMRSAGNDEKSNCIPPMQLTLEDAVEYIQAGEFVEVTPDAVRMGKKAKAAGARK